MNVTMRTALVAGLSPAALALAARNVLHALWPKLQKARGNDDKFCILLCTRVAEQKCKVVSL